MHNRASLAFLYLYFAEQRHYRLVITIESYIKIPSVFPGKKETTNRKKITEESMLNIPTASVCLTEKLPIIQVTVKLNYISTLF